MKRRHCVTRYCVASLLALSVAVLGGSPAAAQTSPPVAVLTSPSQSASVWSPVVFSWNVVPGARVYYLYVGRTPGAKDIVDTGEIGVTQVTRSLAPGTFYARLHTEIDGRWNRAPDVGFTVVAAPAASALTYPIDGSTQVSPSVAFKWSSVSGASGYRLSVGTTAGASDVFQSDTSPATSVTVALDFSTKYYARLETFYGSGTVSSASSFTTTIMPSTLLSPGDGATHVSPDVSFSWTAPRTAEAYRLQVGSQPGTGDVLESGTVTTNRLDFGLPRGGKYYARLWTRFYGTWYFSNSSFSSGSFAVITSPADDARYVNPDVTVSWSGVPEAQAYYLYVGSSWRSFDVFNGGETQATSATLHLAPGRRYYATIWTQAGGAWVPSDMSFVTDTGVSQMLYPLDGATAIPTQAVFAWSAISDATGYAIEVGSAAGQSDVFASGTVQTNTISVPALQPQTKYFVHLVTLKAGIVESWDSSFTTGTTGTGIARMVYPADGATRIDVSRPFTWTAIADADRYYLRVGTAPWATDVLDSAELTSTSVSIAPARFRTGKYYLVLSTRKNGVWQSIQTSFTVGDRASIIAPINGDTDADPLAPIAWTSFPGAQKYYLYVGTSVGARDVYESFETLDTQRSVPNLGIGVKYYLRIHTKIDNTWVYSDSVFTTGTGLARLIQPADGATNADGLAPFVWNALPNAQAYYLTVGSAPGAADAYDGGETAFSVALVPGLTSGRMYYARLYTRKQGQWRYVDSRFRIGDVPPASGSSEISFVAPRNGDAGVDPFAAVSWAAVQGATRYILLIGASSGAWDVFETEPMTSTGVVPVGLGYGKLYFARLWVEKGGQWSFTDISFSTQSTDTVPDLAQVKSHFYGQVKDLTAQVRLMAANGTNIPLSGTPLEALVGAGGPTSCTQFSALLSSRMQAAGVASRQRSLTLTGTRFEAHTLVEYYDPFRDRWAATDPTFGVIYFNEATAIGQTTEELSQITNSGQFSSINTVPLTSYGLQPMQAYYLDPITLFANVFPVGAAVFGPQPNPPDPFLMAQDISAVQGAAGAYLARFQAGGDSLRLRNGADEIILTPLDGTRWSRAIKLGPGWTVTSSSPGAQLYTFKRIMY